MSGSWQLAHARRPDADRLASRKISLPRAAIGVMPAVVMPVVAVAPEAASTVLIAPETRVFAVGVFDVDVLAGAVLTPPPPQPASARQNSIAQISKPPWRNAVRAGVNRGNDKVR